MKKIFLASAIILFSATVSSATECKKQGGGYTCPTSGGDIYVDGSKAESAAAAAAYATAKAEQSQGQQQGQVQGQVAEGGNAYNAGNSVEISNPSHTTSLGVGVNFSVPIASGVQTKNAIDTANWYMVNGDSCTAFMVMDNSPRMRKFKIKRNCGDKG